MLARSDVATRLIQPKHQEWVPRKHQALGAQFLIEHACAALFFSPGLGKTSSTLAAFLELAQRGMAQRMLVIAPLRVCQSVWRQEAEKWDQFRELRFSLLHGKNKGKNLRVDADIFLINPEGIDWLCGQFPPGVPLPFDTLCIDELTKFKNARGKRYKKLRARTGHFARRWGLTGTPAANGYMDLFGQMLILDDGASLGKYITHFRERYFAPDYTGFNWTLRPGCKEKIRKRIAPYVLHMRTEDCVDVPPISDHIHHIEMPEKAWKHYKQMEDQMLTELAGESIHADNAGGVYNKLKQMANGSVYTQEPTDEKRKVVHVHDAKLDALEDLIEELGGEQLLIAYEFQHDLTMIKKRLGDDIPHLGKGTSEKQSNDIITAWNRGEIQIMLAHPQSAGHGLNLQESNAHNVCWFSPTWNLELYEQFIDRIRRSGNEAEKIINHLLVVKGTIDEIVLKALGQKHITQKDLLNALVTEIHPHTAGDDAVSNESEDTNMVKKLSGKNGSPWGKAPESEDDLGTSTDEGQEEQQEEKAVPKGWGAAAKSTGNGGQEKKLRSKLGPKKSAPKDDPDTGEEEAPAKKSAKGAFSKSIQDAFTKGGVPDELEEGEDGTDQEEAEQVAKSAEKVPEKDTAEKAPEKPRKPRSRKAAPKADEKADSAPAAASEGIAVDYDRLADVLLSRLGTKPGAQPEIDMEALAVSLLKKMGEKLQG